VHEVPERRFGLVYAVPPVVAVRRGWAEVTGVAGVTGITGITKVAIAEVTVAWVALAVIGREAVPKVSALGCVAAREGGVRPRLAIVVRRRGGRAGTLAVRAIRRGRTLVVRRVQPVRVVQRHGPGGHGLLVVTVAVGAARRTELLGLEPLKLLPDPVALADEHVDRDR
jgi:hypothetical protein